MVADRGRPRPDEQSRVRDYYRVEDEDGRRFWLYREGLYRPDRAAALVPARAVRVTTAARRHCPPTPSCRSPPISASCAAPRIPRSWWCRRPRWASPPSPSPIATRSPASCAPTSAGEGRPASGCSSARRLDLDDGRRACCAVRPTAPPMAGSRRLLTLGKPPRAEGRSAARPRRPARPRRGADAHRRCRPTQPRCRRSPTALAPLQAHFGDRLYLGCLAPLSRRRRPPAAGARRARPRTRRAAGRHQRRPLPHARRAGRCRTCSPASASTARIDEAGFRLLRQRRAPPEAAGGDGAAVPRPSRGARAHAWRSPSAAASRSTSCATSIPSIRCPPAARRSRSWRASPGPAPPSAIPTACPAKVRAQIAHELALIAQLGYAPYFLTVHDIVRFARAPRHPLPGPRLGGQLRRLLLPRHHRRRSRPARPAVRALRQRRAQRAARHRRRFRARAARGGDPVHLRQVRPRPRRHRRHRDLLPRRSARSATSARRWACRDDAHRPRSPSAVWRRAWRRGAGRARRARGRPRPRRPDAAPGPRRSPAS